MKHKFYIFCYISAVFLSGCAGALGEVNATNPVERGLSYVAVAIVTHGVLQIFFRK